MNLREALNRQDQPNSIAQVLAGLLTRYEGVLGVLDRMIPDGNVGLRTYKNECDSFIRDMERGGIFTTVVVKVELIPGWEESDMVRLVLGEDDFLNLKIDDPEIMDWFGSDTSMLVIARVWYNGLFNFRHRIPD